MIYYFGHDDSGYYVQPEGSEAREYVSHEQWLFFVEQAKYQPPVQGGDPVKLAITISGCVEKYEGETLVETVQLGSETSII